MFDSDESDCNDGDSDGDEFPCCCCRRLLWWQCGVPVGDGGFDGYAGVGSNDADKEIVNVNSNSGCHIIAVTVFGSNVCINITIPLV